MRESHICPKCRHNRILAIQSVPDDQGAEGTRQAHAALAYDGEGFFGGEKLVVAGLLSSCICRRCGYTELYTTRVEDIPVDGRLVRELVGPEPENPYR